MKKIIAILAALCLLCTAAFAQVQIIPDENPQAVCVTLDGTDWTCVIEDEAVVTIGDENAEETTQAFVLAAAAPGYSAVEFTNGSNLVTVSAYVDADLNISILSVVDDSEGNLETAEVEIDDEESTISVELEGEGWGTVVEDGNVVSIVDENYDEETDTYSVTLLAGADGLSDVNFVSEDDEEDITVVVKDGEISLIETDDNEVNKNASADLGIEVSGETMTVTRDGNWDAYVDKTNVIDVANVVYDETAETWTATFIASEDGVTDVVITNGDITNTITVYVTGGKIETASLDGAEEIDESAYVNPSNYEYIRIFDIVLDDEDDVLVYGALGNIEQGDDGISTTGFTDDDYACYFLADNCEISMPDVDVEDLYEYFVDAIENDSDIVIYAHFTVDEDNDITSLEYTAIK